MCDVKIFCLGQTYTMYFPGKAQKRKKKRVRMAGLWLICFPPSKNMRSAAPGLVVHPHNFNHNQTNRQSLGRA